ncbi:MAG: hypothetical protein IIA98_05780, partial [Proteobacteria bacterium]|nr:hypothetical protein [Pseudomonadota bacterium]
MAPDDSTIRPTPAPSIPSVVNPAATAGDSRTPTIAVTMGDPGGILSKGADPSEGRETVVMTFTVAHHYEKDGDDEDQILAPASQLRIDDIVSHDYP